MIGVQRMGEITLSFEPKAGDRLAAGGKQDRTQRGIIVVRIFHGIPSELAESIMIYLLYGVRNLLSTAQGSPICVKLYDMFFLINNRSI